MKKIFVLFLSLILCLPMSFTPVYAEEASHDFYDDLTSYDDLDHFK